MKNPNYFIFSVIPFSKLGPFGMQAFSYTFEKNAPEGSLVRIPFAKRTILGIIARAEINPPKFKRLRSIREVLEPALLTANQIALAEYIAKTYFVPLALAIKPCIADRVSMRKNITRPETKRSRAVPLTESQLSVVERIVSAAQKHALMQKEKTFYLFGPVSSGKTETSIAIAERLMQAKKQLLFLIPDLMLASIAHERFCQRFGEDHVALISGKISRGQLFNSFEKIKSGAISIIIGTKSALFAPFQNLACVIVDEEQDPSHKQWDASPRYDARHVAIKLAEIHHATIVFQSATPSMDWYPEHKTGHATQLLTLPPLNLQKKSATKKTEIHIINMRLETWEAKRKSRFPMGQIIFSKPLIASIEASLKQKNQTLLLTHQQGMSRFSVCKECKRVFKCPNCQASLVYQLSGTLFCLRCSYSSDDFPRCEHCTSIQFRNIGFGTQKIEQEARKLFPYANIVRADSSSLRRSHAQETLSKNFTNGSIDILIGTLAISKGWNVSRLETVGIMDADNFLGFPDFNTDERTLQTFLHTCGQINRIGSIARGRAYIQTYQPEHRLFRFVSEDSYLEFLKEECENRKLLGYPPFSVPILLSGYNADQDILKKESERVFQIFSEFAKSDSSIHVLPPYDPMRSKMRDRYRKNILIKFSKSYENTPLEAKFRMTLEKMPKNWYADVHPISFI